MTHREVGYWQGFITVVFLAGYFITLRDFIHGNVKTPPEWEDTLKALISALTAGVLAIIYFWFQRQRHSSDSTKETPQ